MAFWGPTTSSIDWCEENYRFTSFIAELANTLSNVATIALAFYGCGCAISEALPFGYIACFTLFLCVGLGSFAFHATLAWTAQLADELPMILCVSQACFLLFEIGPRRNRFLRRRALGTLIVGLDIVFTIAYYIYRNPVFHQVIFAILMLTAAGRALFLLKDSSSALSRPVRSSISVMLWIGASSFAFGFLIWGLDNAFCSTLTVWKHAIGWPSAFLLEGHAWWHLLTAGGTYAMLVGVSYLSLCISEGEDRFKVDYSFGFLPLVRRNKLAAKHL